MLPALSPRPSQERLFRVSLRVLLVSMALGLATLAGCEDDDDDHAEEEHLDAVGSALVFGADTLVRATSGDAADVSGMVNLMVGDTLGPCQVLFLNDSGAWFIPEHEHEHEEEEEHGLEVRSSGGFSGFGDAETWQVWFVPTAAGTGTFRLAVTHEGHDDYISPQFPVTVTSNP